MGSSAWAELRIAAAALALRVPPEFESQVRRYLEELSRWERVGRLTRYAGEAERLRHLVVESLMLLSIVPDPGSPLLDIGSGAGVPGLVVKLARPDWEVVLVEAGRRRANFLLDVSRTLGLTGLAVRRERAERLADGDLAGRFRAVTMRAVAPEGPARRLARPFLHPRGALVMPLAPGVAARRDLVREVTLRGPGELPWRRRFLIIPRTELESDVPRGTYAPGGPRHRRGEPEGRRRQDDDGA